MTCDSCGEQCGEARDELYKDAIEEVKVACVRRRLPQELIAMVLKYAYHDAVMVTWQTKMRCRCRVCVGWVSEDTSSDTSGFEEDYSSGEDADYCDNSGYLYGSQSAQVCTMCFLEGIERVMISSNTLPFLRMHANAFFNDAPVSIDPYKYTVPDVYDVTYYRRKKPVVTASGRLAITSS